MKLFVWEDVLTDYTSGIMFAIAKNVDKARDELLKECKYIPTDDLMKEPSVYDLKHEKAFLCWGGG